MMSSRDVAAKHATDWREGWWEGAKRAQCVNFDARPSGMRPELIVLHHISLPAGCFEGETVLDFANRMMLLRALSLPRSRTCECPPTFCRRGGG